MLRAWWVRAGCCGVSLVLSGCSLVPDTGHLPVVVKILRTIDNTDSVTTEDYQRQQRVNESILGQLKSMDPSTRPQLTLSSRKHFIDEVARQTASGFGPDLVITDSETALGLYQRKLLDPITLKTEDKQDIPQALLNLATAKDGQLVGRPVNQFMQLACFNKTRIRQSPPTLEALEASSDNANYGFALQLKDLFWSAEAFGASRAMEAVLDNRTPTAKEHQQMTRWLQWLKSASYQQNVRFLNNQGALRKALIKGELDWITCWSSSLPELREQLNNNLGIAGLPLGPSGKAMPTTRLQVWALGRNSSAAQRRKALAMLDFIGKPWAQKTFALQTRTAMPVNQKAAPIVASKIPGGLNTLQLYLQNSSMAQRNRVQAKARVFRDPSRYDAISTALLDTIYDIHSPEEATQEILQNLKDSL